MATMTGNTLLKVLSFVTVLLLVGVLAFLTLWEEDPCAGDQADISAAVLAEEGGDQDALVNRAIIKKGVCEEDDD